MLKRRVMDAFIPHKVVYFEAGGTLCPLLVADSRKARVFYLTPVCPCGNTVIVYLSVVSGVVDIG